MCPPLRLRNLSSPPWGPPRKKEDERATVSSLPWRVHRVSTGAWVSGRGRRMCARSRKSVPRTREGVVPHRLGLAWSLSRGCGAALIPHTGSVGHLWKPASTGVRLGHLARPPRGLSFRDARADKPPDLPLTSQEGEERWARTTSNRFARQIC